MDCEKFRNSESFYAISGAMSDFNDAVKNTPRPIKGGFAALMRRVVRDERAFYQVALTYGIAVTLLSLAVPVAVQMVINIVANTAQGFSLFVVCAMVMGMLTLAAVLFALQIYTMELFCRRFFARNIAQFNIVMADYFRKAAQKINAHEVIKRFYEIMFVQKAMPNLIISGFALALQMVVGLMVVAFYHPFLLGFNIVFVVVCLVIWRTWHKGARESARQLSKTKYEMAGWLGTFADHLHSMDQASCEKAWQKSNALSNDYIQARKAYFNCIFGQTIGMLCLYVAASTGLLGLGGWLVIEGQLTLGQLAAAELILSAVFFSLTRVGYFLGLYYELCVSAEKLDAMFVDPVGTLAIGQEAKHG